MKRPYVSRGQLLFSVTYIFVISSRGRTRFSSPLLSPVFCMLCAARLIVKSDRDEIEFCNNGRARPRISIEEIITLISARWQWIVYWIPTRSDIDRYAYYASFPHPGLSGYFHIRRDRSSEAIIGEAVCDFAARVSSERVLTKLEGAFHRARRRLTGMIPA